MKVFWLLSHDRKFSLCQEFPLKRRREGQEVDTNSPTEGQRSAASKPGQAPKDRRGGGQSTRLHPSWELLYWVSPSHNCWPVWSPSVAFLEWHTSRPHLHPVSGDPALRRGQPAGYLGTKGNLLLPESVCSPAKQGQYSRLKIIRKTFMTYFIKYKWRFWKFWISSSRNVATVRLEST